MSYQKRISNTNSHTRGWSWPLRTAVLVSLGALLTLVGIAALFRADEAEAAGGSSYVVPAPAFHRADYFGDGGWITGLNEEVSGDGCYTADVPIATARPKIREVTMYYYNNSVAGDIEFILYKRDPSQAGPPLSMATAQSGGPSSDYPRSVTDSTIESSRVNQGEAIWLGFCFNNVDLDFDLDEIRVIAFEIVY